MADDEEYERDTVFEMDEMLEMTAEPDPEFSPLRLADISERYLRCLGELDDLRSREKTLKRERWAIEAELKRRADAEGVDGFRLPGVTVTIGSLDVAKYDPEHWDEIVKQLVADDKTHVLYRRLSAAKLTEAAEHGYRVPKHIQLASVPQVRHRRTKG